MYPGKTGSYCCLSDKLLFCSVKIYFPRPFALSISLAFFIFENICSKYSSIKEFVSYIDELNTEMENKDNDKVKLLKIHKSKGMEYPVVFIIGCNEEILPHYKNENVDDERRLFYVAITRAEKELYLSYVDLYNGQTKLISSFIKDIEDTIKIIKNEKISGE